MRDAGKRLSVSKKTKRRKVVLILLCALALFSLLLFHVWISSRGVGLALEIDRLSKQKEALEEENEKLSLEIAELKSPERISKIAVMELNMIRPPKAEVITLEATP
jgi:cell division protein FtsL